MSPWIGRSFKRVKITRRGILHPMLTKRQLMRMISEDKTKEAPLRDSIFDLKYVKGWPACGSVPRS